MESWNLCHRKRRHLLAHKQGKGRYNKEKASIRQKRAFASSARAESEEILPSVTETMPTISTIGGAVARLEAREMPLYATFVAPARRGGFYVSRHEEIHIGMNDRMHGDNSRKSHRRARKTNETSNSMGNL